MFRRRVSTPRSALAGVSLIAVVVLTGCGTAATADETPAGHSSAGHSSAPAVQARLGALTISGGYVPRPASPDVAAAYLTITDSGDTGDAVTAASSDAGGTTTLHRTVGGAMVALDRLDVPAHGSAAFAPGAAHLMIENPTRTLVEGGTVRLTLTFEHAGTVTVDVPVTGYRTGGATSPMPGMS